MQRYEISSSFLTSSSKKTRKIVIYKYIGL